MSDSHEINLHIDENIVYAGDVIKGTVTVTLFQPESGIEVGVNLIGEESTFSTTKEFLLQELSDANNERRVRFLFVEDILAAPGNYSDGQHTFPFMLQLKRNLPSTYNFPNGWIQYFVEASIRKKKIVVSQVRKHISVRAALDFRAVKADFDLGAYCGTTARNDPSICCFNGGPAIMDVYLLKRVFMIGESVPVKVDISNTLDEDVDSVEVKVKQTIELKLPLCRIPHTRQSLLYVKRQGGVPARSEQVYQFKVVITSDVPNFSLCTLFSQSCCLEVTAFIGSVPMVLSIPIVVGYVQSEAERPPFAIASQALASPLSEQNFRQNDHSARVRSPPPPLNISSPGFNVSDQIPVSSPALYPPSSPKPLLPSRGPAPYSSYRQRSVGFSGPKPLTFHQRPPVSAHGDGPVPVPTSNSSTAYPPVAGPSMPLPEGTSPENPPSYESLYSERNRDEHTALETVSSYNTCVSPRSCDSVSDPVPHPPSSDGASSTPSAPSASAPPPLAPMTLYSPSNPPPSSAPYPPMPPISAPYPPTPPNSAPYPPTPPISGLYPPENRPSPGVTSMPMPAPYPLENTSSGWNLIRSSIPHLTASRAVTAASTPYPPVFHPMPLPTSSIPIPPNAYPPMPLARTDSVNTTFPVLFTPGDGLYPPPRQQASTSIPHHPSVSSAPYPTDTDPTPPKCGVIGFAIMKDME